MTEETKERLGAHEVAAWLRRHPKRGGNGCAMKRIRRGPLAG